MRKSRNQLPFTLAAAMAGATLLSSPPAFAAKFQCFKTEIWNDTVRDPKSNKITTQQARVSDGRQYCTCRDYPGHNAGYIKQMLESLTRAHRTGNPGQSVRMASGSDTIKESKPDGCQDP
jgi:hypothetical protein